MFMIWWIWPSVSSVKGERYKGLHQQAKADWKFCFYLFFLTLGPSGYCPLMETGLGKPRVEERGLTCCKVTRWMGRTAECGTGWRSQPPRLLWQSYLFERWLWRSGFPFAARGLGRHRGKAGLKQEEERRDRADSWGPLGTTDSLLGFDIPEEGREDGEDEITTKHECQHKGARRHTHKEKSNNTGTNGTKQHGRKEQKGNKKKRSEIKHKIMNKLQWQLASQQYGDGNHNHKKN